MKIIRRIAKPCGIAGGIWGIIISLLSLMLLTARTVTTSVVFDQTGKEITKTVAGGPFSFEVYLLMFAGLMGTLSIFAIMFIKRRPRLGVALLWISALAILLISIVMLPLLIFFIVSPILLILAAVGLRKYTTVQTPR